MKVAPHRLTLLIDKVCRGPRNFSYGAALLTPTRQTEPPREPVDTGSKWPVEVLLKEAVQSGFLHISVQTAVQILKTFQAQGSLSAEQICTSQYCCVSISDFVR